MIHICTVSINNQIPAQTCLIHSSHNLHDISKLVRILKTFLVVRFLCFLHIAIDILSWKGFHKSCDRTASLQK